MSTRSTQRSMGMLMALACCMALQMTDFLMIAPRPARQAACLEGRTQGAYPQGLRSLSVSG